MPKDGPIKRFLLFCFYDYYPAGGWNDFRGSYDTLDEAKANASDWWHVIDRETGERVAEG